MCGVWPWKCVCQQSWFTIETDCSSPQTARAAFWDHNFSASHTLHHYSPQSINHKSTAHHNNKSLVHPTCLHTMTGRSIDCKTIFRGTPDMLYPFDVLCGKDYRDHPGNKLFKELVQQNCKEYQDASRRDEKAAITVRIMNEISEKGGYFLTPYSNDDGSNPNEWVKADDKDVRDKVSHALRSAKDPNCQAIRKRRKTVAKPELNAKEKILLASLKRRRIEIFEKLKAELKETAGSSDHECGCTECTKLP